MQQRSGLKNLSSGLKTALHRLIAGVKVADIGLIEQSDPEKIDYSISTFAEPLDYCVHSEATCQDYEIGLGEVTKVSDLEATGVSIDVKFESDPVCMEIVDPMEIKTNCGDFEFGDPIIDQIQIEEINGNAELLEDFVIRGTAQVTVVNEPISAGQPKIVNLSRETRTFQDIGRILKRPMVVKPAQWSGLDKGFIVTCWDALNKKAQAKLGRKTGSSLEMMGVYRKIDLKMVRRSEFDRSKRELKLYFNREQGALVNRSKNYVIIIGIERTAGKIIQAVIQIDN